ncbi:MAG: sulfurtransferase-like selenium metabolism protein YedF [Chloroflexi bacterium]|nr:sulfurtransferase-like selenium metabolism protein YedF [Chloroflexota bacterium]MBU1748920.1 sulfurtransferase-like selenium metabolism protein YedF [Chloroflexota bacterium]
MSEIIDARGLPCPQPVILTKQALLAHADVVCIVDNETAQHNVTRMATKIGRPPAVENQDDGIYLRFPPEVEAGADAVAEPTMAVGQAVPAAGPLVVYVSADVMGRGEPELGSILIRAFLHTLNEVEPRPDAMVFVNTGVKLAAEGSSVLEDLQALVAGGTEVLICGTCLSYFELKDKLAVGEISNMYTIAETMLRAGKIVSP